MYVCLCMCVGKGASTGHYCIHHVEKSGRRSDYPDQEIKRQKGALSRVCSTNISPPFPTGVAGSLSWRLQKRTEGWHCAFQRPVFVLVRTISRLLEHQCRSTGTRHCWIVTFYCNLTLKTRGMQTGAEVFPLVCFSPTEALFALGFFFVGLVVFRYPIFLEESVIHPA